MKFQSKNQAFREASTAVVCDVFNGQPCHDLMLRESLFTNGQHI